MYLLFGRGLFTSCSPLFGMHAWQLKRLVQCKAGRLPCIAMCWERVHRRGLLCPKVAPHWHPRKHYVCIGRHHDKEEAVNSEDPQQESPVASRACKGKHPCARAACPWTRPAAIECASTEKSTRCEGLTALSCVHRKHDCNAKAAQSVLRLCTLAGHWKADTLFPHISP